MQNSSETLSTFHVPLSLSLCRTFSFLELLPLPSPPHPEMRLNWQLLPLNDSDNSVTVTSVRDDTHQRAGPSEQWFIPKMRQLSRHLADRTVEGGYYRPRVTLAEKVDQRVEAAGLRLARHCKLINRAGFFGRSPPRSRRICLLCFPRGNDSSGW